MPVCSRGRPQIPGRATRETVVPQPSDQGTRPPPGTRERPRAHRLGRERARSVGSVTSARATGWPHSCGVSTAHCDQRFTRGILTSPRRTESRYGIRITTEGGTTRSVVSTQNFLRQLSALSQRPLVSQPLGLPLTKGISEGEVKSKYRYC